MRGRGLEIIMAHIVRPSPEHLDRGFDGARNFRRFQRVIDREPPPESSALKVTFTSTFSGAIPRNFATSFCNKFGACVGARMMQRSSVTSAMQFIVSAGACA